MSVIDLPGHDGYGAETYGESFADVYDDWYADVSDVDATVATIARLAGDGPGRSITDTVCPVVG